jgi:hypothetical protein
VRVLSLPVPAPRCTDAQANGFLADCLMGTHQSFPAGDDECTSAAAATAATVDLAAASLPLQQFGATSPGPRSDYRNFLTKLVSTRFFQKKAIVRVANLNLQPQARYLFELRSLSH